MVTPGVRDALCPRLFHAARLAMTTMRAGMARAAVHGPFLLWVAVWGCGTAVAADMHDHGKATVEGRPAGPVRATVSRRPSASFSKRKG